MPDRSIRVQRLGFCPPVNLLNTIIEFTDDTAVMCLIAGVMKQPAGRTDRSWRGGASRTTWKPRRWSSISGGREGPFPSTEHMWKRFLGDQYPWGGWGPHLHCQHISTYEGAAETPFTLEEAPGGEAAGTSVDVLCCCLIFTLQKATRTAEKIFSFTSAPLREECWLTLPRQSKENADRQISPCSAFGQIPAILSRATSSKLKKKKKSLPTSPNYVVQVLLSPAGSSSAFWKGERIAHAPTELRWLFHHRETRYENRLDCCACTGSMGRRSRWTLLTRGGMGSTSVNNPLRRALR